MKRMKWIVVVMVVAIAAFGVAAVAAHPNGMPGMGGGQGVNSLTVIAEALGMEEADVLTALQGGQTVAALAEEKGVELTTIVDALVAAHAEHNAAMLETFREHITAQLNGSTTFGMGGGFGMGNGFGMGDGFMGRGNNFATVIAEALGIEQTELLTALQNGQTVAELAEEKGVELTVVVDALVTAHSEILTAAVEAGRITQEQADARLETFRENVTAQLSQSMTFGMGMGMGGGRGGHHGGMGMGMGGGRPGMGMGMGQGWGNQSVTPEATPNA